MSGSEICCNLQCVVSDVWNIAHTHLTHLNHKQNVVIHMQIIDYMNSNILGYVLISMVHINT